MSYSFRIFFEYLPHNRCHFFTENTEEAGKTEEKEKVV